ncbi:hypothetical protein BVRB_9g214190 [Beta vulgaris subsp. vulgaris]|nr:hypothetical protein BVRB_9g214190 [Beta vulgaris subsp. vulgaris]
MNGCSVFEGRQERECAQKDSGRTVVARMVKRERKIEFESQTQNHKEITKISSSLTLSSRHNQATTTVRITFGAPSPSDRQNHASPRRRPTPQAAAVAALHSLSSHLVRTPRSRALLLLFLPFCRRRSFEDRRRSPVSSPAAAASAGARSLPRSPLL